MTDIDRPKKTEDQSALFWFSGVIAIAIVIIAVVYWRISRN